MERIKLPIQRLDAQLAAQASDNGDRRAEMIWYSGATILRFSYANGVHNLTLSMDPGHVRLDYLKSGRAPFLNAHSDWSIQDVIGVIEDARLEGGKGRGTVRFSQRDDVTPIWQDVQDGILRNVSVGAKIHRLKETTKEGDAMRSFVAIDWEPQEVSIVPIGADPNACFAASAESEAEIEFGADAPHSHQELSMENTNSTTPGQTQTPDTEAIRSQAAAAERMRIRTITALAERSPLGVQFAQQHIDNGSTVEQFREALLSALLERSNENPTRSATPSATITRDERETLRQNAGAVIMNLFDRRNQVDPANDFRGMSVLRLAEEILNRTGRRVRSRAEIVELSMHNAADFPLILADSARKQMLAAYALATPTYRAWAKASTTPDFKLMSRLRLSETPSFLKVPEGAQITLGTMSESREQYAIATYGRGISFTRQMLINDDLGAFKDLLNAFGLQAARLENKTVYAVLTANAAMADGTPLFHANHGNLGAGAIGNASLDAMFTAMATQKGLDGASVLNLTPKFLITPVAKAATAQNAMTATGNNIKPADQNWFAGRLTPIADAELDVSSTSAWYAACDPAIAPGVEYAHLEGAEGPQSIRKENEDAILGVQIYCFIDFGAKAVDYRTVYKSTGV
jgi:hypothetical protein